MPVSRSHLLRALNACLKPEKIKDYCPNGLQIEGAENITRLVTGVTASQALIDSAVSIGAEAILVHHGYFWKGESSCLTGMKKRRIATLLANNINLFAYHLPLDIHPTIGNNAQLAKLLDISDVSPLVKGDPTCVVMRGHFKKAISATQLAEKLHLALNKLPLHESAGKDMIESVAWCTGGGQSFIELAAEQGVDAYITGEVSEPTIHVAREMGMHFYAAGHHATERYGVKALGEYLQSTLPIDCSFVDIDNPA